MAFDRERASVGEFIGPFLLGLDPYDVSEAADRLRQASFLGWRNAWMELAFWDLAAQARGIPLWRLFAEHSGKTIGAAPDGVEAFAAFGEFRPPAVRAESIERARRLGFKAVRIGLRGTEEEEDKAQLRAARTIAGRDDFGIMVHAHQAWSVSLMQPVPHWSFDRALRFAEFAAEQGARWLQEPLQGDDWDGLAELTRRSPVPIAGGDLGAGVAPLRSLIDRRCLKIVAPDVTFAGLCAVAKNVGRCVDAGIGFSPASYGDGLAVTANIHAAAAWEAMGLGRALLGYPWDPPAMIPEHRDVLLAAPVQIRADGKLPVPTDPGLGLTIDEKALRRYAQRFYTLTPVRFAVSSARKAGLRQTAEFTRAGLGARKVV
jgi:L-alanine-DL-glutamate epimerase-like enolase superfamily enzyme